MSPRIQLITVLKLLYVHVLVSLALFMHVLRLAHLKDSQILDVYVNVLQPRSKLSYPSTGSIEVLKFLLYSRAFCVL